MARKRARWKRYQGRVDPSRLVFIDETWAKTNMTRTHGRAPQGQRLLARVPHGHWVTMTFLAALRADGITAPCVIDGPINGAVFLAWVVQFLVPTLSWCQDCGPATSSCSTIWAATKGWPCDGPFAQPAHTCCSCRLTART